MDLLGLGRYIFWKRIWDYCTASRVGKLSFTWQFHTLKSGYMQPMVKNNDLDPIKKLVLSKIMWRLLLIFWCLFALSLLFDCDIVGLCTNHIYFFLLPVLFVLYPGPSEDTSSSWGNSLLVLLVVIWMSPILLWFISYAGRGQSIMVLVAKYQIIYHWEGIVFKTWI